MTIKFSKRPEKIRNALHKDNKTLLTFEVITLSYSELLRSSVQVLETAKMQSLESLSAGSSGLPGCRGRCRVFCPTSGASIVGKERSRATRNLVRRVDCSSLQSH